MAKQMLEAELESQAGDQVLSPEELLKISIFDGVKAANLERYPGAVILRSYKKGQVICRQGEAGWTAFYILKSDDLLAIREGQPDSPLANQIPSLQQRVEKIQAAEKADEALALKDASLVKLDAETKRSRADEFQAQDANLANQLSCSAEGDELRAQAVVSLNVPHQTSSRASSVSLLSRVMTGWFGSKKSGAGAKPKYIPIDGPVDLNYENPVATLNEGELFGEMSCINRYPRSATIRVTEDCYMIEMLRNILELLQRNKAFKEQMDAIYRKRVLDAHLRTLPIFSELDDKGLAELASKVELIEKQPGETIFETGDPSDSMYVIRIGMVKVLQQAAGGERVLAYRARGEYVGEIGLMRNEKRMATCIALDHPVGEGAKKRRAGRVELIRIMREDFEDLINRYPDIREKVEAVVTQRLKTETETAVPAISLSSRYDNLGLMQGQKLMLIDLDRCTRCDECVRACASTHADGKTRLIREGPRFGRYLVPSSCRQCLDPVCMIGCPVGSIHKGDSSEIVIEDWCIGCEICAKQCPYDSINMHGLTAGPTTPESTTVDVTQQAVVCDQCGSLADGKPSCVYACPHDAAERVDARTFFATQV